MTETAPLSTTRPATAPRPMRGSMLDRIVLIFPVILIGAIAVMIWSLQSLSDKQLEHPSVGLFHSGEYATENGLSGQVEVTVSPQSPGQLWHLKLTLLNADATPVERATVLMHGVEGTRYLEPAVMPQGKEPGVWEGDLLLFEGATSVMIHADVPGGEKEDWVAEWKPKGTDDVATP